MITDRYPMITVVMQRFIIVHERLLNHKECVKFSIEKM